MPDFIDVEQLRILGVVIVAMILGAFIGFERETLDKPAGLRTHMLVSGAAALLVALSIFLIDHYRDVLGEGLLRADPIRVIEAVITGISFLGAGTIIRDQSKGHVQGLTTAASLFTVTGIGMAVAISHWILAIGLTAVIVLTLRLLRYAENKFM